MRIGLEKWSALSTSTEDNLIHDAKVSLGGDGYVDSILKLKNSGQSVSRARE